MIVETNYDAPVLPPKISVIVCTRNRSASLACTLESFRALDLDGVPPVEVVIVDNGSTDNTAAVVGEFANHCRLPIRRVWEPLPGLSRARNSGVDAANGTIIAFTDDDCLVARNWLQAVTRVFMSGNLQLIAGRVTLYNPGHLPISIRLGDDPTTLTDLTEVGGFLIGASMAFSRRVWERIGPFDTMLGAGTPFRAAEDTEFAYRAARNGVAVRYEPTFEVSHNHGRSEPSEFSELIYGYAIGRGAMAVKYSLERDYSLIKFLYWEIRSVFRRTWRSPSKWPELYARRGFAIGAFRYYRARLRLSALQ